MKLSRSNRTLARVHAAWPQLGLVALPTAGLVSLTFLGQAGDLFWLGLGGALAAMALALRALSSNAILLAASLVLLFSTERLVIAMAVQHLRPEQMTALLAYDEFVFPALVLFGLPRYLRRWRAQPRLVQTLDVIVIGFAGSLLVAFLVSDAPVIERLLYARRFLGLPMVYLAARTALTGFGDSRRVAAILFAAGVLLAGFGFVERFGPPGFVWGGLADPVAYYAEASYSGSARSGTPGGMPTIDELPHAFWSFEGGVQSRRLVSTFLEAPTLSMFFALAVLLGCGLALSSRRKRTLLWILALSVVGLALVLTLGKGGWALAAAGVAYLVGVARWRSLASPRAIILLNLGLGVAVLMVAVLVETTGFESGLKMHLAGLVTGVRSAMASPFGLGLGTSGVFASQPTTAASESMLGTLLAQTGWLGSLAWGSWILATGSAVVILGSRVNSTSLVPVAAGSALSLLLPVAALTESVGGLIGMWAFPFMAGLIMNETLQTSGVAAANPTDPRI